MDMSSSSDDYDNDLFCRQLSEWALAHAYLVEHRTEFSSRQNKLIEGKEDEVKR